MLIANNIVRKLCDDIRSSSQFAVIVDGTTDNTCQEQESISIRFVDENFEPNEVFLGFFHITSTDGGALASMILDVLLRSNLSVANLRGQTYDGDCNLAGRVNGAQALIAAKRPLAIFVHCLMHCGNLVVADSLEVSTIVRDAVGIDNDVGVLFQRYTKLHNLMENVSTEHASSGSRIWPLCPRRLLCRGKGIRTPLINLDSVLSALQQYSDQSKGESSSKENGFIASLSDGSTLICLQLVVHVILPLEIINAAIQSRKASISDILLAMQMTCSNLQSMRTDVEFNKICENTENVLRFEHIQATVSMPAKTTVKIL